jgi:predicted O-methyltransferase YrrM
MRERTWSAIDQYFEGELTPADPAFHALLEASAAAGLPPIHVSAAQGKLLHLLAHSATVIQTVSDKGYDGFLLARVQTD